MVNLLAKPFLSTWTLCGWCELRGGFRSFRLDRMQEIITLERRFEETPGERLEDFLAKVKAEYTGKSAPRE